MPYSDIGQGLMAAGGAFADAMQQKRKFQYDQEKERQKRLLDQLQRNALSQLFGPEYAPLIAAGADAGTIFAEKARRDKGQAETDRVDRQRTEYNKAANIGTTFDVPTPQFEAEREAAANASEAEFPEILKKLIQSKQAPSLYSGWLQNDEERKQMAERGNLSEEDALRMIMSNRVKPKDDNARLEDMRIDARTKVWTGMGRDPKSLEGIQYIYNLRDPDDMNDDETLTEKDLQRMYAGSLSDPLSKMSLRSASPDQSRIATFDEWAKYLEGQGIKFKRSGGTSGGAPAGAGKNPEQSDSPEDVADAILASVNNPQSKYFGQSVDSLYSAVVSDSTISGVWTQEQKNKLRELLKTK